MRLLHLLVFLTGLTLVAMYLVSSSPTEKFETPPSPPATDPPATDPPSTEQSRVADLNEEDARIDGMVFQAYVQVHAVPPTPAVAKHYSDLVRTERMDGSQIQRRMEDDLEEVAEETVDTLRPAQSSLEMDEGMKDLRSKAIASAAMDKPLQPKSVPAMNAIGNKLRDLASQAAQMANQLDITAVAARKTDPKGLESFISFK